MKVICIHIDNIMTEYKLSTKNIIDEIKTLDNSENIDLIYYWNYSDDVIFNQEKQTAVSQKNSVFISEKTQIKSQGFNISDNGNIIKFNGKSTLILTQ